jgi:hypothetical protein
MLKITAQTDTWSKAVHGDLEIGGFGKTRREEPDMRFYWSGTGSFGHCATREEAIAALEALVPVALQYRAADAVRAAEFAALPGDLQELKTKLDAAEFERARMWGRNPFNNADYVAAADAYHAAHVAFHVAHDRWMSRRRAA